MNKHEKAIDRIWKEQTLEDIQEIQEALALYRHLKAHPEVIDAPIYPGEPMCKICNKTAKEILAGFKVSK